MKIAFYTLGCKVNQYDTQMMKDLLCADGHEIVDFKDSADCYIINTCTVTNMSDRKSRQMISRCRQNNRDAVIVVCGCFSQVAADQVAQIPDVDIILGTANRKKIDEYLRIFAQNGQKIIAPADLSKENALNGEAVTNFSGKTRAGLKIEDGCRNFCSYCIIPFARGNIRSKPPEEVIGEIQGLAEHGFSEVVLTGINLSCYGVDLKTVNLADIIEKAAETSIERIRLGSLEPGIITKSFVSKIAGIDKLMPSFHLSLQSGCDSVLARMNRHYTTEEYLTAVNLLRNHFENCAITTDIIVGFPGETEEEFSKTLAFAEKVSFAKIHIFPYSARTGTKAAAMPAQVPPAVKSEREKRLAVVEQQTRIAFLKQQIHRRPAVLFEQKRGEFWEGHTPNYLRVLLKSDKDLTGKIQVLQIERTDGRDLFAKEC